VPGFVNYKKGCTRLAAASDKVYQLLAHGQWFSPASSTTKTGRHDIAEILLKEALKHQNRNTAMSNSPKQQPNCLKRGDNSVILIVFDGVLYHVCAYTVTVSYPRST
jgi:hypothetical protein